MKKLIIAITALAAAACSPDVEKALPASTNYSVDKVECTAPSQFFAADGKDQLDLQVRIYSKAGTYTDNYGTVQQRYVEVPRDRWRRHTVKFFVNGTEVGVPYTTTTPGTLACYATVDGVRSSLSPAAWAALFPVQNTAAPFTDPAPAAPAEAVDFTAEAEAPYLMPERKVAVIFHIVDTPTNRDRGQILSASSCYAMIAKWNAAFADANIEFVPALKNASNVRLAEPGINRYYPVDAGTSPALSDIRSSQNYQAAIWNTLRYVDAPAPNGTGENLMVTATNYSHFTTYNRIVAKTPVAYWAPAKYLNVWILCEDTGMSSSTFANVALEYLPTVFPSGVYSAVDLPLPETTVARLRHLNATDMGYWNTNPGDLRIPGAGGATTFAARNTARTLRQAGLSFRKSDVANIGAAKNTEVAAAMGAFLGLVPNYPVYATENRPGGAWQDDFCSDTPSYSLWFNSVAQRGMELAASGSTLTKYTCQPPYAVYQSNNVMEFGSTQTRLTPQQLKRIDWVLNNAPARLMWRDLTAITE